MKFVYDETLDKILADKQVIGESNKGGYEITLRSYNKGKPKIQIQPFYINTNTLEKQYTKLSRIDWELAEKVAESILELIRDMKM